MRKVEGDSGAAPPAKTFSTHITRLLALGLPLIGARAAEFIIPIADSSMVGRYDTAELAAFGIGWQTWIFLYVSGLGLLVAVTILTSRAQGAGDLAGRTLVWHRGLRTAVIAGLGILLLCQFGAPALRAIGLNETLVDRGGAVLRAYGWGAPAAMIYLATSAFMAGSGRPVPDMLIMGAAVPIKLGLNWLLVGGHGGMPALGAVGAALATSVMIWTVAIVFALYVLVATGAGQRGLRSDPAERRAIDRRLLQLGVPIALSMALETGAYLALALMVGYVGPEDVGAYRAAMSAAMTPFMIATVLSGATSVLVGHAIGRGDPVNMRRAAASGFTVVAVAMALLAIPIALMSTTFAQWFTADPKLLPTIAACLQVTSAYLLFEGLQIALKLVLRSLGDVWLPFWISVASYWLVGVVSAAFLGVVGGLGAPGIVAGLGIAMVFSALGNAWRYSHVVRRKITQL